MKKARYEVRRAGSADVLAHTAGNLTSEFNWACDKARELSWNDDDASPRVEIRYRGWSEVAADLLVAAYVKGERLDLRTLEAREEDESR